MSPANIAERSISGMVSLAARCGSRAARVAVAAASALLRAVAGACAATGLAVAGWEVVGVVLVVPAAVICAGATAAIASGTTVSAGADWARAGTAERQSEAVQIKRKAARRGTEVLPGEVLASVVTLRSQIQTMGDHAL